MCYVYIAYSKIHITIGTFIILCLITCVWLHCFMYIHAQIISDTDSLKETHYNDEHSVVVTLSDSSVEVKQQQNSQTKNKCCS